jgi:hypothetical protein
MGSKILALPASETAKSSKTPSRVTVHAYEDFVTLWKGGGTPCCTVWEVLSRPMFRDNCCNQAVTLIDLDARESEQ